MTGQIESVTAVVLNWNNYDDTSSCLKSLLQLEYPELEFLVVDNGSTDGSGEKIESEFPEVTLVRTTENLGFAEGMNRGIQTALSHDSDYIWLLNNDLLVQDEFLLEKLVDKIAEDDDIAAITPLIRSYPDTDDIWFWNGRVNWRSGNGYHATVPSSFNNTLISNEYIPFCCTLFSSSVFRDIGLISDSYFLYYEDVDFSTKLRDAGYNIITYTDTEAYHKQRGSSGSRLGPTSSYYMTRNQLLFKHKYHKRIERSFPLWFLIDIIQRLMIRVYNRRFDGLLALCRGLKDGIRGKQGQGPYP